MEAAGFWRRSCFCCECSNQTLSPAEGMGQAVIGLAAAWKWAAPFSPACSCSSPTLHFPCSTSLSSFPPLPHLHRFSLVLGGIPSLSNVTPVTTELGIHHCGQEGGEWCGVHTLPQWGSVLSTLNGHMVHISRGREQRQGGKRGRTSESTDRRGGHFRGCWEVGGMSALFAWPRPAAISRPAPTSSTS